MKRDKVTLSRNFYEAIQFLSNRAYKRIMTAIFRYAMDGEEPRLNKKEMVIFNLQKNDIDSSNKRFENGCKGKDYGSMGGRPKKELIDDKPAQTLESYEDVMNAMACSRSVKNALYSFIQHLMVNKQIMTNKRLEDLILELDVRQGLSDEEQVQSINNAINGGYFDVKRVS